MTCERIYRGRGESVVVAVLKETEGTSHGPGRYHVIEWELPRNGVGDITEAYGGALGDLSQRGTFCYNGATGGIPCETGTEALRQANEMAKAAAGL